MKTIKKFTLLAAAAAVLGLTSCYGTADFGEGHPRHQQHIRIEHRGHDNGEHHDRDEHHDNH